MNQEYFSQKTNIYTEHSMIELSTKISKLCQRYKKVINILQTSFNQYFLNSRFKATRNNFFKSVNKTVNSLGSPPVSRKTIYYYTAPKHYGVVISIPCVIDSMNISIYNKVGYLG